MSFRRFYYNCLMNKKICSYFRNLLGQIREKATDMALGLVQSTPNMQPSNANPRPYDNITSPRHVKSASRHRTVSFSKKIQQSSRNLTVNKIEFKLDVVLDTPVLVLPRSSTSHQVLVAHLGKISINNSIIDNKFSAEMTDLTERSKIEQEIQKQFEVNNTDHLYNIIGDDFANDNYGMFEFDNDEETVEQAEILTTSESEHEEDLDTYLIDIRNMNLFSLDTSNRKGFRL